MTVGEVEARHAREGAAGVGQMGLRAAVHAERSPAAARDASNHTLFCTRIPQQAVRCSRLPASAQNVAETRRTGLMQETSFLSLNLQFGSDAVACHNPRFVDAPWRRCPASVAGEEKRPDQRGAFSLGGGVAVNARPGYRL